MIPEDIDEVFNEYNILYIHSMNSLGTNIAMYNNTRFFCYYNATDEYEFFKLGIGAPKRSPYVIALHCKDTYDINHYTKEQFKEQLDNFLSEYKKYEIKCSEYKKNIIIKSMFNA